MNKVVKQVLKDEKGHFVKGMSGNPDGRAKGSMNDSTKKYYRIKTLAAERYDEAFELLWEAVKAKESWAHQLFFKELVPKTLKHESIILNSMDKSIKGQITTLTEGLVEFDHVTEEDALNRLKTLAAVQLSDKVDEGDVAVRESRDILMDKVYRLENLIEMKEKQDNKE